MTEYTQSDVPDLTLVGFYLEVSAESETDFHDKLYGYDDQEAEAELVGADWGDLMDRYGEDAYDVLRQMVVEDGYSQEDVHQIQEEQETVNDLLRNASIDGHPVLFKTNGTNLSGRDGPTEIPHFGHGASNCEEPYDDCWEAEDAGGVYRVFPSADLIVLGSFGVSSVGSYRLRDDVQIHVSKSGTPGFGTDEATPVE